ncbi:unnamed protein product [Urochloa humidicola]
MQQQLGVSKGSQPKISALLNILKSNIHANPNFLRVWTLLAACSLMTPTFSTKVSPRLYPAVVDSTLIGNKNWCELVIRVLKQTRESEHKNHGFKPCLTFLMVLYLDSLQHGLKRILETGCRVTVWTTKLIKKAIALDTKADGTFGALQLKPEFSDQDSQFLGKPLCLDSFINNHVPHSYGPQEKLKAKKAVQKMCTGFSKLITNFLQSFYQEDTSTAQVPAQQYVADSEEEELGSEEDTEEEEEVPYEAVDASSEDDEVQKNVVLEEVSDEEQSEEQEEPAEEEEVGEKECAEEEVREKEVGEGGGAKEVAEEVSEKEAREGGGEKEVAEENSEKEAGENKAEQEEGEKEQDGQASGEEEGNKDDEYQYVNSLHFISDTEEEHGEAVGHEDGEAHEGSKVQVATSNLGTPPLFSLQHSASNL